MYSTNSRNRKLTRFCEILSNKHFVTFYYSKDEKTQTLIFSGWLDMVKIYEFFQLALVFFFNYFIIKSWNDFNLRWDPDEFGNISIIRVQSSKIWIPGK